MAAYLLTEKEGKTEPQMNQSAHKTSPHNGDGGISPNRKVETDRATDEPKCSQNFPSQS